MTKFKKIDNQLTADRVYKELKNAILKRQLAQGKKLDIFELAEQFCVSRTPVKEAFNRLHLEGLIVIKPRKGTYVAEIEFQKVMEVLDARLLFETWGAKIGVAQATTEDFQVLRTLYQEMDKYYTAKPFDFSNFNEVDIQFHSHIVKMGRNQTVLQLYKSLNAHRITEWAFYDNALKKGESSQPHHLSIIEAFEKRDESLVLELITDHIVAGKEDLLKAMK